MRRGILGGTFDPPHIAHLVVGEAAYRQLDLQTVTFIPAGAPWQKAGRSITDARHRWAMTQAAIEGVPYFSADDREVLRDGWSFTIDTLEAFGDDDVTLILGADAAQRLPTWHRSAEVLDRVAVAVVPRPGVVREAVENAVGIPLHWLDAPLMSISGTDLRVRANSGQSVRFLVRDAVHEYIEAHSIYG